MCLSAEIIPYCSVNITNEMLQLKVQSSLYKSFISKTKYIVNRDSLYLSYLDCQDIRAKLIVHNPVLILKHLISKYTEEKYEMLI